VIQLDQYVKGLLDIKIGNQVKFQGTPGISENRVAVQIGKIVREG
jgi:flagellar motor switch protein FliM